MTSTHKPKAVAIGVLLLVGSAHAQQPVASTAAPSEEAPMERVQVTGSRINLKQAQISGVGPVTVIDAEAIQRSGAISAEGLLQRLPASAGGAGNQTSAYWTGNGYGTTQVNLRGLGIDRTLVLLDGRRVVNGGTGANRSVDLNMIPIALIIGISTFGSTNLTENTQFFTELLYSNRKSNQLATPGSLGVYRPILIAATDPTNPTGQNLTLERRRLEEAGPRQFFQETNTFRVAAGLKGALSPTWDWSAALNWGRTARSISCRPSRPMRQASACPGSIWGRWSISRCPALRRP